MATTGDRVEKLSQVPWGKGTAGEPIMSPEDMKAQLQMLVDGTSPRLTIDFGNGHSHTYGNWESDPEVGHGEADRLLVETLRLLGYGEAMDIYESQTRWMA